MITTSGIRKNSRYQAQAGTASANGAAGSSGAPAPRPRWGSSRRRRLQGVVQLGDLGLVGGRAGHQARDLVRREVDEFLQLQVGREELLGAVDRRVVAVVVDLGRRDLGVEDVVDEG